MDVVLYDIWIVNPMVDNPRNISNTCRATAVFLLGILELLWGWVKMDDFWLSDPPLVLHVCISTKKVPVGLGDFMYFMKIHELFGIRSLRHPALHRALWISSYHVCHCVCTTRGVEAEGPPWKMKPQSTNRFNKLEETHFKDNYLSRTWYGYGKLAIYRSVAMITIITVIVHSYGSLLEGKDFFTAFGDYDSSQRNVRLSGATSLGRLVLLVVTNSVCGWSTSLPGGALAYWHFSYPLNRLQAWG